MKNWPANGGTVGFPEIVEPIVKALKFAYRMKRINRTKDIPYDGLNIGKKELVDNFDPVQDFKAKSLKHSEEEQGRDAMVEIISVAVRLGIEQGRRLAAKERY